MGKRWQPRIRAKAKAASTGGMVIDTRARMGRTASIGSTDQDGIRHLTVSLPRGSVAGGGLFPLAGAVGAQVRGVAAEPYVVPDAAVVA
ncbi:hypothetical protein GCM10018793_24070 [Streptomyces sulfonofaciens]|uniref:Uncharacterized protein n=1 Tax=Streptomyces sulfonofaciens TaxID=68272 RepID=A0A919G3F3_9ACTN|nr:hypothetical protein GCM10018793_24070 [Streptomyces sulfonofaciens]